MKKDDFLITKSVLISNPKIKSILSDNNILENSTEKLMRLIGVLTFICLNGTWDEKGVSDVSYKPLLDVLKKYSISIGDCPYGDIFKEKGLKLSRKKASSNLAVRTDFASLRRSKKNK